MRALWLVIFLGLSLTGCGTLDNPLNGSFDSSTDGEVTIVEVVEIDQYDPVSASSADYPVTVEGGIVEQQSIEIQEVEQVVESLVPTLTAPAQRLFFFDYDSSAVSAEDLSVIQAHAAYLINNPVMIVRLEGHADERGSREYNLSLGERRAQTMSDLLIAEGVNSGQIEIISYGEENPLETGAEELFWAQNRRVELTYPQ